MDTVKYRSFLAEALVVANHLLAIFGKTLSRTRHLFLVGGSHHAGFFTLLSHRRLFAVVAIHHRRQGGCGSRHSFLLHQFELLAHLLVRDATTFFGRRRMDAGVVTDADRMRLLRLVGTDDTR